MINTTDFLGALRNFEYVAKQKELPKDLKERLKIHLLNEIDKLVEDIWDVELDDEMEVIEGINEALKNL